MKRRTFGRARRGYTVSLMRSLCGLALLWMALPAPSPGGAETSTAVPEAQSEGTPGAARDSRFAEQPAHPAAVSANYRQVQERLARGWNTWDVHSVMTHVLLPEGLAIHAGLKHNTTLWSDGFLPDALIGRMGQGAEEVFPGAHAWDGSYTDLRVTWQGHNFRIQTAHEGQDLALLATPLPSVSDTSPGSLPPTIVSRPTGPPARLRFTALRRITEQMRGRSAPL